MPTKKKVIAIEIVRVLETQCDLTSRSSALWRRVVVR